MYFVDSSALVKAYVQEPGTAAVLDALRLLDGAICVSGLVAVETAAAIARLRRTRALRRKAYERARTDFREHFLNRYFVVDPSTAVVDAALELTDTYHARRVGGADLLHLATAEYVQSIRSSEVVSLMCCDAGLREIAEERGFDVFDPLRDPLGKLLPHGRC